MDNKTQIELEAAVLRKLLQHLAKRNDVQNIELMNLAGFCRNCLGKWYAAAAREQGIELSKDEAREFVYGMPYDDWKERYQREATAEQAAAFQKVMADPDLTS
ncbi:MAG: DUF1244 domain-containing protein [Xanthomonadales bacterium]|nr:DUF1244 domain-containing protein [Xanthomonadales bacterium]NNL96178.1 DUF1244 domain-containing protein [Xanthomonadales bacterium]